MIKLRLVNILKVLKKVSVDKKNLRTLILVLKTGTTDRLESSSSPSTGSGLCFEFPPIIHCYDWFSVNLTLFRRIFMIFYL